MKVLKQFVADKDLRGQNVLLLTSLLREVLKVPREKVCYRSMSHYHIIDHEEQASVRPAYQLKKCLDTTTGKQSISHQERSKNHEGHDVAVDEVTSDVLGHLPHEILSVAFLFLGHDGCIMGNSDGMLEKSRIMRN